MSNVKDVDLARHAWDTPPFLLIVSPTPPVQSVDAYVRTLGQSRDNQTKKRLTIFFEYGALSPAIILKIQITKRSNKHTYQNNSLLLNSPVPLMASGIWSEEALKYSETFLDQWLVGEQN